jgi:hypothetical protein
VRPAAAAAWPPQLPTPPAAPPPTIRSQSPDEAVTAAPPSRAAWIELRLPPPEELGIAVAARPVTLDWSAAHRRLEQLGACCIRLEKLANGGCRFTCVLPTGQADRTHCIESLADNAAEAVAVALDRAEAWARQRTAAD